MNLHYIFDCIESRLYDYKTKVPGFPQWKKEQEIKKAYELGKVYGDYFT